MYDEFDPLPLKQHEHKQAIVFDTFDAALDEFFAKVPQLLYHHNCYSTSHHHANSCCHPLRYLCIGLLIGDHGRHGRTQIEGQKKVQQHQQQEKAVLAKLERTRDDQRSRAELLLQEAQAEANKVRLLRPVPGNPKPFVRGDTAFSVFQRRGMACDINQLHRVNLQHTGCEHPWLRHSRLSDRAHKHATFQGLCWTVKHGTYKSLMWPPLVCTRQR